MIDLLQNVISKSIRGIKRGQTEKVTALGVRYHIDLLG